MLILVSVTGTVAEVLVPERISLPMRRVDDALALLFLVELSLRFYVARKKRRFFERYWIDWLAVLPFWFFRVLRVLRLFRATILLTRRVSPFRGSLGTRAEHAAIGIGSTVLVLLASLVLMRAEAPSNFQLHTFEDVLWYAMFTLIGGEPIGANPMTHVGRWTTLLLMLGGMTLFGVFVGLVSAGMVSRLKDRLEVRELDVDELVGHVVVCGWNNSAPVVLRELFSVKRDRAIVLVTEVPVPRQALPPVPRDRLYEHIGDFTRVDVLEQVAIREAQSAVLLADTLVHRSDQDCDARTVLAALTIERIAKDAYTIAELHNRQNEELLRMAGVENVVVADHYAGMILGTVHRNRALVRVLDEVLTRTWGNAFHTYPLPDGWAGQTVGTVARSLSEAHRAVLVAVDVDGTVTVNPLQDVVLKAGDQLVVLRGPDFRPL